MLSPGATSLLLRNESSLKLIDIARRSSARVKLSACCCVVHPTDSSQFIAVLAKSRRLYLLNWASLKLLSPAGGIKLVGDKLPQGLSTRPGTWCWSRSGASHVAQCVGSLEDKTPYFAAFDASKLKPETTEIDLQVWFVPPHLNLRVRAVVGIRKSALYFLDTMGWVCSVELGNLRGLAYYTRHFFIPPTWQMGNQKTVITMVSDTAVALSRGERLVVMDGFLEFEERVVVGEGKGLAEQAWEDRRRPGAG
ncbi:hypothetical protein C8A05DRAFT_36636 [Staphylotrichum tortipilum]|uniref:Uncharacterized protein n=1 Tax=Staphylotrichum tortipilum TaxID=2831512 RepID=A0AAN6MGK2_9PEZI|nr:hypothetical protein C8A05DRAFT_36636 [Staphylotrichum longicolle]